MRAASKTLILVLALCLLGALGASAADITASDISWQAKKASAVLTISGPGDVITLNFGPGEAPFLPVSGLTDGSYTWNLVYNAPARARGIDLEGARGEALSGHFTVTDNLFVVDRPEATANKDQVFLDDLIVAGSACVGLDCVNGESFGFDTIRLKENNLRIKAQDTSNSASFPSNDWQITFNDTSNGGANKFSIDDIDGGRTPFTIEASAPSHSLYVDDGGRVGLGKSTPVVELHITNGDTPTVRLEQDGSSGFTAQTWDMAGNETNFFVRDASNGSRLPFKIVPAAPTNSLYVNSDGNIGLGTSSPDVDLDISNNGSVNLQLENSGNTDANGTIRWRFQNDDASDALLITKAGTGGGEVRIDNRLDGGTSGITMFVDGGINATGAITPNSTRDSKADFASVDTQDVLTKLAGLDIQTWRYKMEDDSVRHMGPVAEDFAAAFELGKTDKGIATVDSDGVALAAIQALYEKIQDLEAKNQELTERLSEIEND